MLQNGKHVEPKLEGYVLEQYGLLRFKGRMYIPEEENIQRTILKEFHRALYCAHLGAKKMHVDM